MAALAFLGALLTRGKHAQENEARTPPSADTSRVHAAFSRMFSTAGAAQSPPSEAKDSTAEQALRHHREVTELNGTREAVDRAHAESLAALRAHAREVVFLLYDAYNNAADADERFAAVSTLSQLESPFATEALLDIARRPVPERSAIDPHHDSERDGALMERMAALDGLAALAISEDDAALQSLYAMAIDPKNDGQPAIKIAAIRGFIGRGPGWESRATAVADHVPAALRWTLSPRAPRDRETMKKVVAQNPMPLPP